MKTRVKKKQDKSLLNFSLVCERIAATVVEKVSNAFMLQKRLDEHERFLGDLLIMLAKRVPQCVIKRNVENGDCIWDEVLKLINENKELKAKLDLAGIKFDTLEGK